MDDHVEPAQRAGMAPELKAAIALFVVAAAVPAYFIVKLLWIFSHV